MIVTLMKLGDDYCIEAGKDGSIAVFSAWPAAMRSYAAYGRGAELGALIDGGERGYRLLEVTPDDLETAVVRDKLYSSSGIVSNYKWYYKLLPEAGAEWYARAEDVTR